MKLEIGKEYKTRNGLKVKIYDIAESGVFPVVAGLIEKDKIIPITYTLNGRYYKNELHLKDIIGEWQEPLDFDWSCLPPWANEYIAMDGAGTWYAYSVMPKKSEKSLVWFPAEGYRELDFIVIPNNYAPKNFKGGWENSLFKNPNK